MRVALCLPCLVLFLAPAAWAQRASDPVAADTARLRQHVRALAAQPRVSGAPTHVASAEYVMAALAAAGLDTSRVEFQAFAPHPIGAPVVARVDKYPGQLPVAELRVADDSVTYGGIWPTFVAYAHPDSIVAPLLYVNRGESGDYDALTSLRVDARGTIVIARFGTWSALQLAREAARRGAVGLILYNDPADDGYTVGDFYPDGAMRHPDAMRRVTLNPGLGDPTTPGWPRADTTRLGDEALLAVPPIPVISVGYSHANQLLQVLRSVDVPAGWQGGLPFRYHVGPGDLTVMLVSRREEGRTGIKTLVNTFARVPGRELPDEIVLVGARRDAFGPGASDNASGVASLLEVARLLGEKQRAGWAPRRTIVLATWDGGVWGQLGSSEYVRALSDAGRGRVVAYVDLARTGAGRRFSATGSPMLEQLVRDVAGATRQPADTTSVLVRWRASVEGARLLPVGTPGELLPFSEPFGTPAVSLGFVQAEGVSQTAYDTYLYVARFSDPDFRSQAAAADMALAIALRLVEAAVHPYAVAALGRAALRSIDSVRASATPLAGAEAVSRARDAAQRLVRSGDLIASRASGASPAAEHSARINAELRQVEPALAPAPPTGQPAWARHRLMGQDHRTGTQGQWLPQVQAALATRNAAAAREAFNGLASALLAAAAAAERASALFEVSAARGAR
jgi:N-acetylated-alpha-linked acidic dipeptidase